MKKIKITAVIFLVTVLIGCATGSAIVTGSRRPPLNPNDVKIYLEPPASYEIVGLVEAESDVEFSTQAAMDRVFDELKRQAARIGANGVLLTNTGSKTGGAYVIYNIIILDETKTAKGQAIYVFQE